VTGPEHYKAAEQCLKEAHIPSGNRAQPGWLTADELVAEAQVHATLALAAATALAGEPGDERWWRVAARVNESGGPA
jgi:hypothetical protein